MLQEAHLELFNRLQETLPNEKQMLSVYLNVLLILEKARPSYRIDINPIQRRQDVIDIVLSVYSDTFEIFEYKTPHLYLKSNKTFITSTLENMTHENSGKALGYRYTEKDALDIKLMRTGLSIMASSGKTVTQLYATCVPTSKLNENIMNNIHNDIINYNNILNKYNYKVHLKIDLLWYDNDHVVRNCKNLYYKK